MRAQFNLAPRPAGSDAETGALTDRGQQAVVEVTQAWERYLKLKPKKIDPSAAAFAALAYGALQDYDKAVEHQEAVGRRRGPSAERLLPARRLRLPRGSGGEGRRGGEGGRAAHAADQRNTVRSLIKDLKKQGAQIAKAVEGGEEGPEAGRASRARSQPATNFGPLPGQGARPAPQPQRRSRPGRADAVPIIARFPGR